LVDVRDVEKVTAAAKGVDSILHLAAMYFCFSLIIEQEEYMIKDGLFWLNDAQWCCIEGFLSLRRKGAHWLYDRRVISGIIHVIQTGLVTEKFRAQFSKLCKFGAYYGTEENGRV
jgi:hypothetical protein